MSEATATRKAVVTTAQVQEALASYLKINEELGNPKGALEFDKGFRGKGFAVYSGNEAVSSFETKEEAFVHYTRWVEVAQEIVSLVVANQAKKNEESKTTPARKAPVKAAESATA